MTLYGMCFEFDVVVAAWFHARHTEKHADSTKSNVTENSSHNHKVIRPAINWSALRFIIASNKSGIL